MRAIIIIIAVTISSLADPGPAVAAGSRVSDPDSIPQYRMDEIVVTARRTGTSPRDLAISTSTIDSFGIETSLRNSSTDLASALPGVFVMRTGDFGRSDVNVRGLGSRGRRTIVLVDGRPETMGLFGCTVTHSFALHDLEKVELVRGPSSMLYGSGAMGGVLNMIPRRVRGGLELDARVSGGSFGTVVSSGRAAGRSGRLAGSLSADHRESDGHVDNSSWRGTDLRARGEAVLGSAVLALSGGYFEGFKEEPLRSTADPSAVSNTWNDYRRGSVDAVLRSEGESILWSGRVYRNFGEHEFSDGYHSRDVTDGTMLHAVASPSGRIEISAGADFASRRGRLPDMPGAEWSKWEAGGYGSIEYRPLRSLVLSAGARYNRDEVAGGQTSPSLGAVWKPDEDTSVRLLVSHGFRSPQINELYMYPPSSEDLEAEKVWNYEAGVRRTLPLGLAVDVSVFRMDGDNLIELAPAPDGPGMRFSNTGEFVFDGMELTLEGRWRGGLSSRISWTGMDTGRLTMARPGSKTDLELAWRGERFTAALTGSRVDDYYASNDSRDPIPSHTVLDVYGEAKIAGRMGLFAGMRNVTGEEYSIYADLPGGSAGLYLMPGRALTAGFRYGL